MKALLSIIISFLLFATSSCRLTTSSRHETAEQTALTASALRLEGNQIAFRQAIKLYQQIIQDCRASNKQQELIRAQKDIGEIYLKLCEYKIAQEYFDAALEGSRNTNNRLLEGEILNNLGRVSCVFGDNEKAIGLCQAAFSISKEVKDTNLEALSLSGLGEANYELGNYQQAQEYCQAAFNLMTSSTDINERSLVLATLGFIYSDLGEAQKALEFYQQALTISQSKSKHGEALALGAMGKLYSRLGENQEALKNLSKARYLIQDTGDKIEEARILNGLGYVYERMGDYNRAIEHYRNALELFRAAGYVLGESDTQYEIARASYLLKDYPTALAFFQSDLALGQKFIMKRKVYFAQRNIGMIQDALGKKQEALKAYQAALPIYEKENDARAGAVIYNLRGDTLRSLGQSTEAAKSYQQALSLAKKTGDQVRESQIEYNLACLFYEQKNFVVARNHIYTALKLIESLRTKVTNYDLRTSYFAAVHQTFELYLHILMQPQQGQVANNDAIEAFTISERARARTLLDLLNESRYDIKQGVDPQILEHERALQQSLKGKADRKLLLSSQSVKEAELAAVKKEVDDLTARLDDVRSQIRQTSPRYAALTQPQPLKAEEIQQLLDDETVLLEFKLGDKRSYLWAVTNHSIDAYTLPSRTTIEPLVRNLYQLLTVSPQQEGETIAQWHHRNTQAYEQYWPRAAELSQMILGPVADKLGNKRLVIVGDGELQLLPFAALPAPRSGAEFRVSSSRFRGQPRSSQNPKPETHNSTPLILNHEITSLPSASSLKLLREDRVKPEPPNGLLARWTHSLRAWFGGSDEPASMLSVAILADPVFGKEDKRMQGKEATASQTNQPQMRDVDLSNENMYLPRLIATREEAEGIQLAAAPDAVLLKQGFDVNRSLLESGELNRYGVVHFATHGFWDSTNPEMSAIVLSRFDTQRNPLNGTLRLSDIYNLQLPKELVVLSACETAVGKDIRGEGLIALTRGFMYAGAARVMASLWKVEDNATAEMMKIFYQHLLQGKKSPAAALRAAQIAMWQKAPRQVPYDWAAFVLQGEYR